MKKLSSAALKTKRTVSLLLHDIRSVYNVGSIFRTADAFGVSKIYISGYTPSPRDRFGRVRWDIAKVALGAEHTVAWEQINLPDPTAIDSFIKDFKKKGNKVFVLEQDPRAISLAEVNEQDHLTGDANSEIETQEVLLIVGNEVGGVEKKMLDVADLILEIPMQGKKESLNVSVATGIALFALL